MATSWCPTIFRKTMMILKMLISVMAIFLNSKPIMAASKILPAEVAFRPEVLCEIPALLLVGRELCRI
jgi:hypothetical protein